MPMLCSSMREIEHTQPGLAGGGYPKSFESIFLAKAKGKIRSELPDAGIAFSKEVQLTHRGQHYGKEVGVFVSGVCVAWVGVRIASRNALYDSWGEVVDGVDAPGCRTYGDSDGVPPGLVEHIRSMLTPPA